MKINELLTEQELVDLVEAATVPKYAGGAPRAPANGKSNLARSQAWQQATQQAGAAPAPAPAPAPAAGNVPVASDNLTRSAPKAKPGFWSSAMRGAGLNQAADAVDAYNQTQAQGTNTATASDDATAPAATSAPAPAPAAMSAPEMGADEIVSDLKDTWSKAKANQGSKTSSPKVQQQIRSMAQGAGMAGQTMESTQDFSALLLKKI